MRRASSKRTESTRSLCQASKGNHQAISREQITLILTTPELSMSTEEWEELQGKASEEEEKTAQIEKGPCHQLESKLELTKRDSQGS